MFGRGGRRNRERIEPRSMTRLAPPRRRSARRSRRPAASRGRGRPQGRAAPGASPAGRAFAAPPPRLLGFRARRLGRRRRRRPVRLLRQPVAADRPARGAQAAAQHRHSRRRRLADRQSRRHRRRGGASERPAALSAQGVRRHRGSPLLFAFRHRSDRHRARGLSRRHRARRHGGRLDADPAARQEPVPDAGAHAVAQDPGGDPRALAGAQIFQGPDPRTLSQPRLFRLGRLRRRSGGAEIFRQERAQCHAVGSGGARRADEVADPARAQPQSQRRQRARRAGHHRHGRAGPYHRGDGQARRSLRPPRSCTRRAPVRSITPPTM